MKTVTVLNKSIIKKMRKTIKYLEKRYGKRPLACIVNPKMFTGLMDLPEKIMSGSASKEFDTGFVTGQMGLYSGLQVYLDEERIEDYEMIYDKDELGKRLKQIKERKK